MLAGFEVDLELCCHEREQGIPASEVEITGQGSDVVKESLASAQFIANGGIKGMGLVQD